jgi:hypothetical protein
MHLHTYTQNTCFIGQDNNTAQAQLHALCTSQWRQACERTLQAIDTKMERFASGPEGNLGALEQALAGEMSELLRNACERAAQVKADATPPKCPHCGAPLSDKKHGQQREYLSRFGSIRIKRTRGYCPKCREWKSPADTLLGLDQSAGCTPLMQEMSALLISKMPVQEASVVLEKLSSIRIPPATLAREAQRQGERALKQRRELDAKAVAPPRRPNAAPYELVVLIDAWNIRERDHWGQSAALRSRGKEAERWHWVYTATCFRLDQRGKTAGGRPVITERGYVATREGIEGLREQLHAETLRRGLGNAREVLVIADGAAWIWKLVEDRFAHARQRLDYYHAMQHLAAVGRAVCGEDAKALRTWLRPLARQLKQSKTLQVISSIEQALESLGGRKEAQQVREQLAYFKKQQGRMDYAQGKRLSEPIGSGAIEATCRQYQCRFKRPGQFWSRAGDEALLCLETFWRNQRWSLLYPHTHPPTFSNN